MLSGFKLMRIETIFALRPWARMSFKILSMMLCFNCFCLCLRGGVVPVPEIPPQLKRRSAGEVVIQTDLCVPITLGHCRVWSYLWPVKAEWLKPFPTIWEVSFPVISKDLQGLLPGLYHFSPPSPLSNLDTSLLYLLVIIDINKYNTALGHGQYHRPDLLLAPDTLLWLLRVVSE